MKKILLVLCEGFEFYEAAVFIDVMGWNCSDGGRNTKLITCGMTREVKSTFNHKIIVDCLVSEISEEIIKNEFDALALPGGFKGYGYNKCAYDENVLNLIRAFDKHGKLISAICVGSLPLGKSGILVNKKATVYNQENGIYERELKSYKAILTYERICECENITTSQGPETGIEVAFRLLERLTNLKNRQRVEKLMGF